MNRLIKYLAVVILMISCAENDYNAKTKESASPIVTISDSDVISTEDAYSLLISERLHEYFDKQKILKQYPLFNSNSNTYQSLFSNNDSIIDVKVINNIQSPDFDSTSLKTVVSYYNSNDKDTLMSKIIRTRIVIEEEEYISSKVLFSRSDNK